jgi:membrane fusion protein (multidrug efflux system)
MPDTNTVNEAGVGQAVHSPVQSESKPPGAAVASPDGANIVHYSPGRKWAKRIAILIVLIVVLIVGVPWIHQALITVSTDDAYVNGHVTFVAARVPGQVLRVLVDDNNRVHKGDLLVQLDPEPYQVAVNIAAAAVAAAQADVVAAQSDARGIEGQMRSLRYSLDHAIEDVDNQIALLHAKVAALISQKAILDKAQGDYERVLPLAENGSVTKEEIEHRKDDVVSAQALYEEALQGVYQIRVALGLPPKPPNSDDLTEVPPDLDQTFSTVKEAQASLMQAAAKIGYYVGFNSTPKQMVEDFYKQDADGNIDRIYAKLLLQAPTVKQAETELAQKQQNLAQAELDLRYCNVVAEIDGVITRRQVNPGNNVVAGQSLMAIRSLTDIWIDANFKETQLRKLRIGQSVDLDVDTYGRHQHFQGRISGFTMGTGSTLALLPAENATGNFVKVVQRLPVRIDLIDYDPDKAPLFIGLSVEPTVFVDEPPAGPNAGKVLQPYLPLPETQP